MNLSLRKSLLHVGLIASLLVFSTGVAYSADVTSTRSCVARSLTSFFTGPSRAVLKKAKASELAALIAVDPETQNLVANPHIAQYVYLNYFAEKVGDNELKVALQDIVDNDEVAHQDLFGLVNEKLADRLKDPEVQAKVKAAMSGNEAALRPSAIKTKFYTLISQVKQMAALPKTLAKLRKLTNDAFSQANMDRGLFDFYGATQLGLKESQLRAWTQVPGGFSAIRPGQIQNISPDLWVKMTRFASETEMPIHGYSTNSGEGLRGLLPVVSTFMGKTAEENAAWQVAHGTEVAEGKHVPYCTNVWCSEETRHENADLKIAEHVAGTPKVGTGTYEAGEVNDYGDADEAIKHLVGRNSSEWNANSIYLLLRAHSEGPANTWIDNIRADETKHMAIFSAGFKYLYGTQLWKRTSGMLDKIMILKKEAALTNSNAGVFDEAGKPTLFELAAAHLFVEKKTRDYIKSVPLKTMAKLFDTPVTAIKPLPSEALAPEKQKILDEMIVREKASRDQLARWKPDEREKYLALRKVESEQGPLIESMITHLFNGFSGAEVVGSPGEKAALRQISQLRTGLPAETNSLVQMSLRETLRDYQIMNNGLVRSKPGLEVKLKSAAEGFIVVPRAPDEAKVLLSQKINDTIHQIRVEKPAGMEFKPGQAVRLTITTPNGLEVRPLSLASSPNQNYLEFAVRNSDSSFKKAFTTLKPGAKVTVNLMKGAMDYQTDKPAVMIAGGIGITPFRSMIQFTKDENLKTPIYLYYGNRGQVAFGDELDQAASQSSGQLRVTHIKSGEDPNWTGEKGRIDKAFLAKTVPTLPKDAIYYIVGSPSMVEETRLALYQIGVDSAKVKFEVFKSSQTRDPHEISPDLPWKKVGPAKEPTVCYCHSVSESQIKKVIQSGARTLAAVESETKAGTGCGQCQCTIENILACEAKQVP